MNIVQQFYSVYNMRELLEGGKLGELVSPTMITPCGLFCLEEHQRFVLFRNEDGLNLRIIDDEKIVLIDESVSAEYIDLGKYHRLVIYKNDKKIFETTYIGENGYSRAGWIYDGPQHFREMDDFGMFIRNVIEKPDKRDAVFRKRTIPTSSLISSQKASL